MQEYLYNLATDRSKGFIADIIKVFLFLLSLVYGLAVRMLVFFYRLKPYRLNCKVISVGNITLGGTGKTSLVEYIVRYLRQQGHKVAIIARGYKRKITSYELRVTSYENMGDEPFMLSKNLGDVPIIVDSDRIRAVKCAIKDYFCDTVILDDAFQQWKIKKDLEIITIDATNPFGNRYLIPRGILREPLSSLRRADIFVLTKTNLMPNVANQEVFLRHPEAALRRDTTFGNPDILDLQEFLSQINPAAEVFESMHKPKGFYKIDKPDELLSLQELKGKTVTLFSGIGDPNSFENLVAGLGIKVGLVFRFRDHHSYTQSNLDKIVKASQDKGIETIITTEKDAARLDSAQCTMCSSAQFLVLRIAIEIKDEQRFHNRLLRLYSL